MNGEENKLDSKLDVDILGTKQERDISLQCECLARKTFALLR